jgi:adenylate cyclase
MLSFGAYAGEPEEQRSRRRIILYGLWIAIILTALSVLSQYSGGQAWSATANVATIAVTAAVLVMLRRRPHWFGPLINVLFAVIFVIQMIQTAMFGGLMESGLIVLFGLLTVLAALIAFGIGAAGWWFAAFVGSVLFALAIPNWVEPIYPPESDADAAFTLIATAVVTFAVMVYFVHQRDRFQRQSDDLLHNILPGEIVGRLKAGDATIADSFDAASVLFADVVDFTPLSAQLSPHELVALLDSVFTTFDGFVEELGLEKIKTVGDEYMVAAGVPRARPDHAEATAELALRIRDHVAANTFEDRAIRLRIGIHSGPVVAGVIGSHKFAYDLWGDVVNTASRMESEGVPGSIQVSAVTHELIRDRFICDPRGAIYVKGKGTMETYLLVSRSS